MEHKMLDKGKHINPDTGCMCRHVRSDTERFRLHNHNYYEIFLVLRGSVCHMINGKLQHLEAGHLLFIRDFDIHDYKSDDGNSFEFINLAFEKEFFHAICDYLGENSDLPKLLTHTLPPTVYLHRRDTDKLFFALTELGGTQDESEAKLRLKILLMKLFTENFSDYPEEKTDIPLWLEITYEKMKQPSNFIKGVEKMYEICPKTREHLCRSLKKHYNTSPIQLVTDLRLALCVSMLTTSNLTVTDICYECGFENLSWFYKVFVKKYNVTPSQYRKKLQK